MMRSVLTESNGPARQPKYMELRELIRSQIISGSLEPGNAIETEQELARHHRVSVSTVKEALKDLVKDGLIVRVRGRGTFVSESLRKKEVLLPLLTPVLGSGLTRSFYLGYEERSVRLGLSTVLWSTRQCLESENGDHTRHKLIKDIQALAMIATSINDDPQGAEVRFIGALLAAGKKVVVVDQELSGIPGDQSGLIFLRTQNLEPMFDIGKHLVDQGYCRIGFLGMDTRCYTQAQRIAGLRLAIAQSRGAAQLVEPLLLGGPFMDLHHQSYDQLPHEYTERVLRYARTCDALCVVNDLMAAVTVRLLRDGGVRVPHECAVTGFDDSEIASTTNPPLTTVRQPFRRMGACAVDLLIGLQDGRLSGPGCWVMESQVVIRSSSIRS